MASSGNGYWRLVGVASCAVLLVLLPIFFTVIKDAASEDDVKEAVKPVTTRAADNARLIGANERDLLGVQTSLEDLKRRVGKLEDKVDDIPEKVVRAIREGTP